MPVATPPPLLRWQPALKWAGLLLGMALGGFFDGILLHQILQWHHLLSAVEGQPWLDLRMQLVIDGLFHGLMYIVLAGALLLLFRARHAFALGQADRYLFAGTLIGFGLWNVLDGIAFHWVLELHHIKMDAASPLVWDLVWFAAFGLLPLAIGYRLRSAAGLPGGPASRHPGAVAASLALLVGSAGWLAALPPAGGSDGVLVVFRPDVTSAQAFNAIGRIDGKVLWADSAGAVWAVELDAPVEGVRALYRSGALLVSHASAVGLGCLAWSRPPGSLGI